MMKRLVAITACGLGLSACSGMPSFMQFELPKPAPVATTVQFESEPAGAEVRTTAGQTCRTPCSMAIASDEFTATFALPGYQPQTVPVRVVHPNEPADPATGQTASPRLVPNPVFVELQALPPPPAARGKRPPAARP
ncbi:MAG: hypothetical protein FJX62_23635, partial [Alphaproteobacteria bacterium]|nr:hypothetical protein [Alphaproteobacteria bacterium]